MIECDVKDITVEVTDPYTVVLHVTVPRKQTAGIECLSAPLSIKIGKRKKKRSLAANAYLWVLCTKIAQKLGISKEEVYRQEIREAGRWFILPEGTAGSLTELSKYWNSLGIGYQTEWMDGETPDGRRQMVFYEGSSAYDVETMNHLLNVVIADAEDQGIETITPRERQEMMSSWKPSKPKEGK